MISLIISETTDATGLLEQSVPTLLHKTTSNIMTCSYNVLMVKVVYKLPNHAQINHSPFHSAIPDMTQSDAVSLNGFKVTRCFTNCTTTKDALKKIHCKHNL